MIVAEQLAEQSQTLAAVKNKRDNYREGIGSDGEQKGRLSRSNQQAPDNGVDVKCLMSG